MQKRIATSSAVIGILAFLGVGFLSYQAYAQFIGPCGAAGSCSGVIGVDTKTDVSIGGTPTTAARLFVQSSSTAGTYAILASGTLALSSSTAIRFGDGTTQTTAASGVGSTLSAANVSFGAFGANTGGGNYSFPANLSVATTTSNYRLEVLQGAGGTLPGINVIEQNTTNRRATIGFGLNAGTTSGWILGQSSSNNTTKDFYIYDVNNSANRLTIDTSGNVGISTTSPAYVLDVYDATGLARSVRIGGTSNPDLQFTQNGSSSLVIGLPTANGNFIANSVIGDAVFRMSNTGKILFSTSPTGATNDLTISSGNIGIGTSAPASLLHLSPSSGNALITVNSAAANGQSGTIFAAAGTTKWDFIKNTDNSLRIYDYAASRAVFIANSNGTLSIMPTAAANVGIGTTTPSASLEVSVANPAIVTPHTNANIAVFRGATSNGISIFTADLSTSLIMFGSPSSNRGSEINWNYNTSLMNLGTRKTGGLLAFMSGNGVEAMRIDASGRVGIGTSTPGALLSVGTSTSGLVATFGNGSGKINVGTIDPVYTIGGEKYATYLPGMTGQKEETTGNLECQTSNGKCEYRIDFRDLKKGSDLWLFGKAVNIEKSEQHFKDMSVLLTPAFDGRAWYEKDSANRILTIYAEPTERGERTVEVSYRLTAPRFDSAQWSNHSKDMDMGFNLDELIK